MYVKRMVKRMYVVCGEREARCAPTRVCERISRTHTLWIIWYGTVVYVFLVALIIL